MPKTQPNSLSRVRQVVRGWLDAYRPDENIKLDIDNSLIGSHNQFTVILSQANVLTKEDHAELKSLIEQHGPLGVKAELVVFRI